MRTRPLSRVLLLVALPSLSSLWATAAQAEAPAPTEAEDRDTVAAARIHYARGVRAYEIDDLTSARTEFTEAYRLSPRPALLYNLARVALRQGDRVAAAEYLSGYLATNPSDAEAVRKELDLSEPGPAPLAPAVSAPVAPPPPSPPPRQALRVRWPVALLLGGGGAVMLTGVGLVGAGYAADPADEDAAGVARQRSLKSAGLYMALGGAALAAGGALALGLSGRREAAVVVVAPLGLGAQVLGRF